MKNKKDLLYEYIAKQSMENNDREVRRFTTQELSEQLSMQRSNLSTLLNDLVEEGKLEKLNGRPVLYQLPQADGQSHREDSCFQDVIGADGSMKHMVQLAKAAILYPEHSLNTLIVGPKGSGKSHMAALMASFARANGVIREDAPVVKFNCHYYEDEEEEIYRQLFGGRRFEESAFFKAQGGILCIDHIELLPGRARDELFEVMESGREELQDLILICAIDDSVKKSMLEAFASRFSIRIDMPSLQNRPLEERLELVQQQFEKEAGKVKKGIHLDAELLRCLLVYRCDGNINQLQADIRLGCANAYVRSFNQRGDELYVGLNDFSPQVRKGLLYYKNRHEELDKLIPQNYSYTFTAAAMEKKERQELIIPAKHENEYNHESMYERIDRKAAELRSRGIAEDDIMTIINADLEYDMKDMMHQLNDGSVSRESLAKVVDRKIIDMVERFLQEASAHFGRVYPESVFYGLCLHVSSTLRHPNRIQHLPNERIMDTVEKNREEYAFSMKFAAEIEKNYSVHLSIDEVVFITMFISETGAYQGDGARASILIAMHGNSTASSMAEVVNSLVKCGNVYAFDMPLEIEMQQAYEELKIKLQEIDNGGGVLLIYDMGSIKTMSDMIAKETGIEIRVIGLPATLLAMEGSRKAAAMGSLDELYDSVLEDYQSTYISLAESYRRHVNPKIIITLCMSGQGGAVQMKNYLEKHLTLDEVDVLPFATSDKKYLLEEVNRLKQDHEILYVIGTYDPGLHGIPYISISQLFETPVDKLDMLLSLKNVRLSTTLDYDIVYESLEENMPELDVRLLRSHLPAAMEKIRKLIRGFTKDQELGLFMHIASAVYHRILNHDIPENANRDAILSRNKRLYNDVKDILKPLERAFEIRFNDDEISYMISIIRQL